jgi:hypothetical protein
VSSVGGESCSKCGANTQDGSDYCRACGAALKVPAKAPSATAQPDSSSGSHGTPAKPLSGFQTGKSKVWGPLIIGIAVIAVAAVIISVATNSGDSTDSTAAPGGEIATASCSAERLQELAGDYVDLGNRTQSAWAAVPDVLTPAEGAQRIRIRFKREWTKGEEIASECVVVEDAESGAAVVRAVEQLNEANSDLYAFFTAFLETGDGSEATLDRMSDNSNDAVKQFNAAWEAFAEETGFSINDNTSTLDESSETD